MRPGEIVVDRASRRFRVHAQEQRTLKELVVHGRPEVREVLALDDVSFRVEPGQAIGLVGRNGSGKTTLLRLLAGIVKPTGGRVEVGGRVGALLELGAGFQPDFSGRDNVYLSGSIYGLSRADVRRHFDEIVHFAGLEEFIDLPVRTYSSGMQMRLGFAIAAHLEADVLLLDEVFAVGDEEFQRKCFGRIFEFKQGGGTIVFVSHDAASVERLCERAILLRGGRVAFDGSTHDAIVAYHRQLAGERDPEERAAGLKEWGSGEARIVSAQLVDAEGDERVQLRAGEPFSLLLRVEAASAPLPPPRLTYELRDSSSLLLAAGALDTADVGWDGACELRFDVPEPPLRDGRFGFRFGLVDASGEHLYHWLDDALSFVVYPDEDEGGLVRIEGRWTREDVRV